MLMPDDFFFNVRTEVREDVEETLNLEEVEHRIIKKAMDKHKGNISNMAKELGITRTTLYNKIEKYEL